MEEKKSWFGLSKRSLSVMATSMAVLASNQSNAKPVTESALPEGDVAKTAIKRLLKPKLVLKLNMTDPSRSLLSMHTSHSSHSSHSSHASHASHASSAPTYTPSYPEPQAPAPVRTTPVYNPPADPVTYTTTADTLAQRTLYKGLKGEDVRQLQQMLKDKGYNVPVSGYFGQQTEIAVKKFQKQNDLPADGKVGSLTLSMLAN